jgi:chloramphenicol O-acetyltransferase
LVADNSQTEAMSVSSTHFQYLFDSTTTEKWQPNINFGRFDKKSTTTTEDWQPNINFGRYDKKSTTTTEDWQPNINYGRFDKKSTTTTEDWQSTTEDNPYGKKSRKASTIVKFIMRLIVRITLIFSLTI